MAEKMKCAGYRRHLQSRNRLSQEESMITVCTVEYAIIHFLSGTCDTARTIFSLTPSGFE
jgi:hypothetical protein